MIKIVKQTLITQFVDDSTGELFEETREFLDESIKPKKKSSSKSKKKDDTDPIAKIEVLDGKVQMNAACVELTGFEPEMKIAIEFEKKGKKITPIMFEHQGKGNRLTKTYTVSCRGQKHDELANFGTIFEVLPYDGKDGYFKLKGDAPEEEDDIIEVPEEIEDPDTVEDVEVDDFVDFNFD